MVSEVRAFKDSRGNVFDTKERAVASEIRILINDNGGDVGFIDVDVIVNKWVDLIRILEQLKQ